MKRRFLTLIISLAFFAAHAQYKTDISANLQVVDKWVCGEGTEFTVYINPQGIGGLRATDTHYKWLDVNSASCQFDVESVVENNSLKCEGGSIRKDSNDPQYVHIKGSGNHSYTITWQFRLFYPATRCDTAKTETYTFTGTTRVVNVIPIPKPPTISVIKPVLRSGESTRIYFTGCPNTFLDLGYSTNPYTGQPSYGDTEFSKLCTENGKPDFVSRVFKSDNTAVTNEGPGVTTFYARCNDNGCISKDYDSARVISQYATPNCGDPKMDEIDGYYQDSRPDYHSYTEETFVCNKSSSNPNCTQQKVYEFMKSRKDYNVFNASDDHVADVFPKFQQTAKVQIQLIGADAVFQIPSTPVVNCETVNLIGPLSLGMNLVTLEAVRIAADYSPVNYHPPLLGAAILSQLATKQTIVPIANPIAQFMDDHSFSITNYTKAGHSLYPGKVVRTVVEDCGQIKIVTIGVGRNWAADSAPYIATIPYLAPRANEIAKNLGIYMSNKNKETGKALFKDVDNRLVKDFNNQ